MQRWVNVSCNVQISRGTNPFFIYFTIGGIHRFLSIHIYLFFFPTLLAIFDKLTDSRLPITDIPVLRITEGVVPNRREPLVVFIMQERWNVHVCGGKRQVERKKNHRSLLIYAIDRVRRGGCRLSPSEKTEAYSEFP